MIINFEGLKNIVSVVDVVEKYLDLHKCGANLKACCPFHDERSASFFVSQEKNLFKCFGCGVSGDAFKFLQEFKKISFTEAIQEIASMYNYALEYDNNEEKQEKERLKEVLAFANNLFKARILKEPAILEYLNRRGITQEKVKDYGLGFCTNEEKEELKKRFNPCDLIASGLFSDANKDRELKIFCNYRITFPLRDTKGKIVSFSARTCTIKNPRNGAKYINGRDTKIFKKSFILYNLDRARQAITQKKQVILCEGFFDVMSFEHFDYNNVICCIGTAFTKEHVNILNKMNAELCFCLDNDLAGLEASIRAIELCLLTHTTNLSVVKIKDKDFKDMGDYLEKNKRPNLIKINGFKFYCAYLLRGELDNKTKDFNYKRILRAIKDLNPFIKGDLLKILKSFLPSEDAQIEKIKKPVLSLLEARIYATMLESEEFRYIARRYLSLVDVEFKDIFKKIILNDFRGLEFLKKYEIIKEHDYPHCLNELKIKGLKNSLKHAIENKDYMLIEVLNHKIKELQTRFKTTG
ncbi:DNA primase [Helicobacter pylori]|uniref:DNA primase n=1 Tax=Helicobacter pylori TaxID=210 RepID=UPI0027129E5B|nr:DNA primase [Helicobacter pylori]MDO7818475.1 DNA primase [Helicobacter pylori]MDO7824625.1 DNA primase [Helicobacter pylori]